MKRIITLSAICALLAGLSFAADGARIAPTPTRRVWCGEGTSKSPHAYTLATYIEPDRAVIYVPAKHELQLMLANYEDNDCHVQPEIRQEWARVYGLNKVPTTKPKTGDTVVAPQVDPSQHVTFEITGKVQQVDERITASP